jgi:hypothetical protein
MAHRLAVRCLQALLGSRWWKAKTSLSAAQLTDIASKPEEELAGHLQPPLLKTGLSAWEAFADDWEANSWRSIVAKWAVKDVPAELQCHLWRQYAPYNAGHGVRLRKAIDKKRWTGEAPRAFGKRLVLRIARGKDEWVVVGSALEEAEPGDELCVRIEVTRGEERQRQSEKRVGRSTRTRDRQKRTQSQRVQPACRRVARHGIKAGQRSAALRQRPHPREAREAPGPRPLAA